MSNNTVTTTLDGPDLLTHPFSVVWDIDLTRYWIKKYGIHRAISILDLSKTLNHEYLTDMTVQIYDRN
jgi:hypothetical protein